MCILGGLLATIGTALAPNLIAGATMAGISGTATATAIGGTAVGLGALAAGGIGAAIANEVSNVRSSKGLDVSALNSKASLSADASNKTASRLQDNTGEKRAISSLRIPLKQTNNIQNVGANTANIGVGLNIPT